ncbi:MAG: DUF4388 domain-containing protein [Coriobacteriia bacterium]|nr:DUF4388 domain-containing protein [Coriobacteriia bacterium]
MEDEVALEGSLSDFSLNDMFRLLQSGKKDGILYLEKTEAERVATRGQVCFSKGMIYHAEVGMASAGDPGERMYASGLITETEYRQAKGLVKIQQGDKAKRSLAQVLIEEGYVSRHKLEQFVAQSVEDVLFDLLRWESGTLRFEPNDSHQAADLGVAIAVGDIAAKLATRLEEWNRLSKNVPDDGTNFFMASTAGGNAGDIHLTAREWGLLCHLHGGRSLRELVNLTGYGDLEIARLLLELQASGLVERNEVAVASTSAGI